MNDEKDYTNNDELNSVEWRELLLEKSGAKKIADNLIFPDIEKQKLGEDFFNEIYPDSLKNFVDSYNCGGHLKSLKDFADNNPKFKGRSLMFEDILMATTIYLRNKYLSKHPESSKKE